jgi:hypothetical protein
MFTIEYQFASNIKRLPHLFYKLKITGKSWWLFTEISFGLMIYLLVIRSRLWNSKEIMASINSFWLSPVHSLYTFGWVICYFKTILFLLSNFMSDLNIYMMIIVAFYWLEHDFISHISFVLQKVFQLLPNLPNHQNPQRKNSLRMISPIYRTSAWAGLKQDQLNPHHHHHHLHCHHQIKRQSLQTIKLRIPICMIWVKEWRKRKKVYQKLPRICCRLRRR